MAILPFILLVAVMLAVLIWLGLGFAGLLEHPPYVPVPALTLPEIAKALDVQPGEVICDLGSGDGRVLLACAASAPGAEFIGVEKHRHPLLLAALAWRKAGRPANVRFLRGDFFKTDLKRFDALVLYLFPDILDRLWPKFKRELRPGARIVSVDYPFSSLEPAKIIELAGTGGRGKRLYLYEK